MPELLLRVVQFHTDGGGSPTCDQRSHDVVAVVDDGHRVADLVEALALHIGADDVADRRSMLGVVRTGEVARPDRPLTELDLLSGDEVVVGPRAADLTSPTRTPKRAWALDVTAGPDSGRSFVLPLGTTTIGRSSSSGIVLGDRSVSRHHASLQFDADGTFSVTPTRDASNGVTIDGDAAAHRVPSTFDPGAVLGLGGTRLVVRAFECQPEGDRDRLCQVDFHRTPYRPPIVADRQPVAVGPIPERPEPRRLQAIAAIAPLVAGVGLFAMTRQAHFLLFTLISPVVMVGTVIDDRRTGRRDYRSQVAAFRDMLAARRCEFERLRAAERAERLGAAPDVAELVRRAERRTIDLWPRGRDAPDFLHLRVGLGDDRTRFPIDLEANGDDDLRAEARTTFAGLDRVQHVPITVDLAHHVLGIHGARSLVDGVVASLAVQIATLHSPDDVTIAAAVAPERELTWMKWLPHLRSVTSPICDRHLATTTDDADALIAALIEVAVFRTAGRRTTDQRAPGEHHWPRLVAVVDAGLRPDPAATSRLLDLAHAADISVVWLASTAAEVPRQASRVLAVERGDGARMDGRLWATDPAVDERRVEVEFVSATVADNASRSLAPVRDASTASLATSIPRTAPLLDVLGAEEVSADRIAAEWTGRRSYGLRFPIGLAADGPLELDLVADGPHTLIGGTSGAGKSELLQSMVAALAARHSPERLNFLFVDYKGGASSHVFERLPHTVGYVTNLSADLSLRALTSLRAELDRRMALMEGRSKDLADMLDRFPDEAPASLVIVVDEFATLVKEVPEFVAGVVDIAQRGRSLGIHLVLATQRPTGSVNENILANTNLRISLRMLDRAESTAVIDSPDAADIPVPLRGRGLARIGPRQLVEFQSSFAGAPITSEGDRRPVLVAPFDRPGVTPVARTAAADGPSHLDVVLGAIVAANEALRLPPPRRPWRDVLPDVIALDAVVDAAGADETDPGRMVLVGMLDAPEAQDQRPAAVDLEESGGLLVCGSGGSGKSTLLRTIAAGVDRAAGGAATLVFDFASRGLTSLRELPSVIDVATGDDLEAVTRHLLVLDAERDRRRRILARHGAEHLSAYHHDHPDEMLDRIVVLIDGFGGLSAGLLDTGGAVAASGTDRWSEIVHRVVIDGRQVGIHTVITSDRRDAIPARVQSAVGARLILRHADPQSYADLGVRGEAAAGLDAATGRSLLDGRVTVQIASVSADPSARAQTAAIAALATGRERAMSPVLASAPLPDVVTEHQLDGASEATGTGPAAVIGLFDVSLTPAVLDVEWSHAAIVGPARSGRSTALAAFVRGMNAGDIATNLYAVGSRSSPLSRLDLPDGRAAFGGADEVGAVLDRVANLAAVATVDERIVVVVDDIDALDVDVLTPVWERLVGADAIRLVAALETRSMMGYTGNTAIAELRRARRMLVLQPDDPSEFLQLTGVKLLVRPGLRMRPGRGVLLADRVPTVVQVVHRSATSTDVDLARSVGR